MFVKINRLYKRILNIFSRYKKINGVMLFGIEDHDKEVAITVFDGTDIKLSFLRSENKDFYSSGYLYSTIDYRLDAANMRYYFSAIPLSWTVEPEFDEATKINIILKVSGEIRSEKIKHKGNASMLIYHKNH